MILTQYNDRLYDSRNFDNYQNYYVIHYNKEKYQALKEKNHIDSFTIYMNYIKLSAELILSVDFDTEKSENIYHIVYGHFYNNQDYFLFKKVQNGKIVGYKVSKCNKGELWHNKLNQLYISNYFGEAKKTAILLNNEANVKIADETTNPALSYIVYSDETLTFMALWNSNYNNELLIMEVNNPYQIQKL